MDKQELLNLCNQINDNLDNTDKTAWESLFQQQVDIYWHRDIFLENACDASACLKNLIANPLNYRCELSDDFDEHPGIVIIPKYQYTANIIKYKNCSDVLTEILDAATAHWNAEDLTTDQLAQIIKDICPKMYLNDAITVAEHLQSLVYIINHYGK